MGLEGLQAIAWRRQAVHGTLSGGRTSRETAPGEGSPTMLITTCHCGAVRMELDSPPTDLNQCHCSICRRYGTLWAYYDRDQVRLVSGPEATQAYCWGDRELEFHRCRSCGCVTHWTANDHSVRRMAINARMLDPADIAEVPVRRSDGPPC